VTLLPGGNISLADNETVPGEQGSSYYNRELTENIQFDLYDPYSVHHPDGWVEIMEVPPDCVCSENRNCKWDDGTYTTHQCQCGGRWMAGSELEACRQSMLTYSVTVTEVLNQYVVYC